MLLKNIKLHKLNTADLQELIEISRQTFIDAFASENSPENIKLYLNTFLNVEELSKELNESNSEFYFAKLEGKTLGYIKTNFGLAQNDFKENDSLELERIYVISDFQGQKIGKRLLDFVIEIAKNKGSDFLWLGVWEKNIRAINFYKKNGFVQEGSHVFKLGDEDQIDFIMKLFFDNN